MTHMTCATCHTQTGYPHAAVAELGGSPSGFEIENAYPNPFFNSTKINFSVPTSSKIRLEIYDMKGQLVNSLIDSEVMNTGVYEYEWNGTNNSGNEVAGGIYFARLTSGNFMKTVKINFAK